MPYGCASEKQGREGGDRGNVCSKQRPLLVPHLLGASLIRMPKIISHSGLGQMWREDAHNISFIQGFHSCVSHTRSPSSLLIVEMQTLLCGPEESHHLSVHAGL